MENQHQHIKGYRDLSPEEVAAMNNIKSLAESVGALVATLNRCADADKRWVALGATQLQQGFMALTRAVAKPTTF